MCLQYDYPYAVAVSNLPWVEEYRPETLDDLISEKEIVSLFKFWLLQYIITNYCGSNCMLSSDLSGAVCNLRYQSTSFTGWLCSSCSACSACCDLSALVYRYSASVCGCKSFGGSLYNGIQFSVYSWCRVIASSRLLIGWTSSTGMILRGYRDLQGTIQFQ